MILAGVRTTVVERGPITGGFYLWNEQPDGDWLSNFCRTNLLTNPTESESAGRYHAPLPYGIGAVDYPLSVCTYLGRTYFCGGHTYNLVIDEHFRVWKQGIRGPERPPSVAGAPGTGAIAYTSWYDELTGERSPLSEGTIISTVTPRTWTLQERPPDDMVEVDGTVAYSGGLITASNSAAQVYALRPGDRLALDDAAATVSYHLVANNGAGLVAGVRSDVAYLDGTGATAASSSVKVLPFIRASHQELWLSVAGGLPQLVMRVPVGVTSVVESVAAGDLGESFSGSFERFPRCTMNVIWNDRQIMAGDPMNPDTVYLSALFFPERYEGLYFRTRSGEPVTGLLPMKDYLLVFTKTQTYTLQGYTSNDFTLSLTDASIGAVSHLGNVAIHGSAYVWTNKGPYFFNGSWHPLSPENEFTQPTSWAHRLRAVHDPDWKTYGVAVDTTYFLNLDRFWTVLDDRYTGDLGQSIAGFATYLNQQKLQLVFDYTTVQPESGGNFSPARFSIDTYIDLPPWYINDKWGQGRLFSQFGLGSASYSLMIHPHYRQSEFAKAVGDNGNNYGVTRADTPFPIAYRPKFVVVWGPRYFDYPGVSDIEGKTFTKLWFDCFAKATTRYFNSQPYSEQPSLTAYVLAGDDEMIGGLETAHSTNPATWSGQSFALPLNATLYGQAIFGTSNVNPVTEIRPDRLAGAALAVLIEGIDLGGVTSFRGLGGEYVPGPHARQYIPSGGGL